MKIFFIALSLLFCMLFMEIAPRTIITPQKSPGADFGNALTDIFNQQMRQNMEDNRRAREQEREYQYYLAELRAQEEMMERERQREQAHQQYLAELEIERIRQAAQVSENINKAAMHE